jgi:CrcB protein
MVILGVALAGGLGALIRWMASTWFTGRAPRGTGTGVVNLVGALALGTVTALAQNGRLDQQAAVILGTGLLGALTTFSTWMVETLPEYGEGSTGVWWRTVPVALAGIGAVWIGMWIGGGVN